MSPPRMVRDPARVRPRADAGELRRRLGPLRPAADPRDRPRRCSRPASPTTTSTGCCGATRWSSTASPAGSTSTRVAEPARARSRATRSCAAVRDAAAAPDGSLVHLAYCTNVHPAEDLDGIVAQLDTYAVAIRAAARRRRARPRAVAGRAGRRRAGRRLAPRAGGCARELDARGLEVVRSTASRTGRSRPPVVKHAVYQPDWTDAGAARVHPRPGRRAGRPAAGRRRPRLDLDAAAGLAGAVGPTTGVAAPPRRSTSWPPAGRARVGDRPRRPGRRSSPSPAASWRPPRRPPRICPDVDTELARRLPRPRPPGRAPGRTRSTALRPAAPPPACRWSRCRSPRRWRSPTRPRAAACCASTSSRGSCTRPGSAGGDRAAPTTSTRRSSRGAARARGGCTTTCRCTPTPRRRCRHHRRAARRRSRELLGGPTPTCDHLDVETYTWGVLPPEQRPTDGGRAGRRHRRRAGVRPRRRCRSSLGGDRDDTGRWSCSTSSA